MSKTRKKLSAPGLLQMRVSFENRAQVELIQRAAAHRGLSFPAFVRLVCAAAAKRALELPPDPLLGEIAEAGVTDGRAA